MRAGQIAFTKDGSKIGVNSVWIERSEIERLLTPAPVPTVPSVDTLSADPPASLSAHLVQVVKAKQEKRDLRDWAERYRDGDEVDSCGNTIYGANDQFPETSSTL